MLSNFSFIQTLSLYKTNKNNHLILLETTNKYFLLSRTRTPTNNL